MTSFSTFVLGSRRDASDWESGCQGLGFRPLHSVRTGHVKLTTAQQFFRSSPQWLYMAGHYSGQQLYSEESETQITFSKDEISLSTIGGSAQVKKVDNSFGLHKNIKVVIWGGCSLLGNEEDVAMMRGWFGDHVMLGFAGLTGWRILQAMFGGGFIPKNRSFFARLGRNPSADDILNAWMETAQLGYGGAEMEEKFRAIDIKGQGWRLSSKKIVKF